MSQKVMQQALEALEWNYNTDLDNIPACEQWAKMLNENITALRAALAEPEQNPFGDDAERYARKLHEEREYYKALFTEHKPQTTHWEGCEAVHPECKAKTELKRKSDAIQRLWKERDELLSECRTLVRQNGEWQELTAELVEALRGIVEFVDRPVEGQRPDVWARRVGQARAALTKVEASK